VRPSTSRRFWYVEIVRNLQRHEMRHGARQPSCAVLVRLITIHESTYHSTFISDKRIRQSSCCGSHSYEAAAAAATYSTILRVKTMENLSVATAAEKDESAASKIVDNAVVGIHQPQLPPPPPPRQQAVVPADCNDGLDAEEEVVAMTENNSNDARCSSVGWRGQSSPYRFVRLNPRFDEQETLAMLKVCVRIVQFLFCKCHV
jgi:hypothetical protein